MTSQEEPTITAISPTSTLGTAAASEHQPEIASPTDREIPPSTKFLFLPEPPLPGTADSITSRVVPKKIFDVSNDEEVVNNNVMTVEPVVPPQDGNLESPDNLDSETYLAETVAKVLGKQTKEQQQLQTGVTESSEKQVNLSSTSNSSPDSTHINNSNNNNYNINNNNNNSINNINNSINNISSSASSQQSIQPPKNCLSDSVSPSSPPNPSNPSNHLNMSQPDSPLTVPVSKL
ncbi:9024_t:CDS:1, partial [Dentiscutata heterogama]